MPTMRMRTGMNIPPPPSPPPAANIAPTKITRLPTGYEHVSKVPRRGGLDDITNVLPAHVKNPLGRTAIGCGADVKSIAIRIPATSTNTIRSSNNTTYCSSILRVLRANFVNAG